jgi:ankyrin repeat protein
VVTRSRCRCKCSSARITPLYRAILDTHLEAVQVLLEHHADVNLKSITGKTPLYRLISSVSSQEGKVVDIVRRLVEYGADPNIRDYDDSTALHQASFHGSLEAAPLLLSYGAKLDGKDSRGRTPFHVAASNGHDDITKLLLEHGAVPLSQP